MSALARRHTDLCIMPTVSASRLPLLLALLLGVVLVVLAGLQWRWIGQWSTVEEARLQSALSTGAANLDAAFSQALNDAADAFPEIEVGDAEAAEALAERWQARPENTLASSLVEAAYWVEPGPTPHLFRLDPTEPTLNEADWPEAWAPWRAYFAAQPPVLAAPPGTTLTVHFDDADSPAYPPGLALLVLPPPGRLPLPVRFVFLPLNPAALQNAVLPSLIETYLVTPESFDVLITSEADPDAPLYASRGDLHADAFVTPDMDRLFGPQAFNQLSLTLGRPEGGEAQIVELSELQTKQDLATPSGRWRLRIQHRAGSIGAAVGVLRRRQLSLAFGVLLVLAAATALLVRSAQTQRRLARQQMEFVAGVSHELRTPLAVIRSAGENLADGIVGDTEQMRQYGALVRDEGQRLSEMVESVLTLAGADARLPVQERLVLTDLVREAVRQVQPMLAGADLQVDLAEPLPMLAGDPAALTLALRNLLANAVRHGEPPIQIEAKPALQNHRHAIALTVSDAGAGLMPGDLPHLFDPFYRGNGAARHTGSGLGLTLVRRVAEMHSGTVAARNRPEGGCTFTLTLPTVEPV